MADMTTQTTEPEPKPESKWADLPNDILLRIIRHLDVQTDLTRLRGVCPQWRTILHPLKDLSVKLYPPRFPIPPLSSDPLILLPSTFYFLSPLSPADGAGWLCRMAHLGPTTRHLFNPFNIHEYFFPNPPVVGSIDLLDCRASPLSTVLCLIDPKNEKAEPLSKKVVGGWNLQGSYDFAVLAQLEQGEGLVLWRLGDDQWTHIDGPSDLRVMDIASHGDQFYAFDLSSWKIGVIDPSSEDEEVDMEFFPGPEILGDVIDGMFSVNFEGVSYMLRGVYFVSSGANLYLVVEVGPVPPKRKGRILVFVMRSTNEEIMKWENVTNLGDQIFFIGYDAAFPLPLASVNLPQWKPDSICLFTRPFPLIFDYNSGDYGKEMPDGLKCLDMVNFATYYRYIRMFTMGDEKKGVVPFQKLPMERYTGLFFPPPAWVKWRCPSRGDADVKLHEIKFSDPRKVYGDHPSDNELSDDGD